MNNNLSPDDHKAHLSPKSPKINLPPNGFKPHPSLDSPKTRLARKIDHYLLEWKSTPDHLPLIVSGARQVGKTEAIRHFAAASYQNFIEINFTLQPQFKTIFQDSFDVESIIKNISLINPDLVFIPGDTLIFFDEIQDCPSAATSLKSFARDGRYDIICSGYLMGLNYQEIESNSVGFKEDYIMRSLDFEEFLWAKGYQEPQIEELYQHMLRLEPYSEAALEAMFDNFREFMTVGGMPDIVWTFIQSGNFSGTLKKQQQILKDYEEDITKYAGGLDQARILSAYRRIPVFLGNENKKFQISKVSAGARTREYAGVIDWLSNAGIVNCCYALSRLELPLKGNYNPDSFRLYFADTGLLIGSLDEEAQADLRNNRNFNTYKGAIYENVVSDLLVKSGASLFFYKNEKSTIELDFVLRDANSLVPIEVKAIDGATPSLNNVIASDTYPEVTFGIKLCNKNLGWNGKFFTFPYFMAGWLKRFLKEQTISPQI